MTLKGQGKRIESSLSGRHLANSIAMLERRFMKHQYVKKLVSFLSAFVLMLSIGISLVGKAEEGQKESPLIIEEIKLVDDENKEIIDQQIVDVLETKLGELSVNTITEDLKKLRSKFPQYAKVTSKTLPGSAQEKVIIVFEFQRRRIVKNLRILSNSGLEISSELRKKMQTISGELLTGDKIQRDSETIKRELDKIGYPMVKVSVDINPIKDEAYDVNVVFHIESVTRQVVIGKVHFEGRSQLKESELRGQVTAKQSKLLAGRKTFISSQLKSDAAQLQSYYVSQGFWDAKVTSGFTIEDNSVANIVFNITEGKRFLISRFVFSGNQLFNNQQILEKTHLKDGRYFNDKNIRLAMQTMRDMYGEQGYIMMNVNFNFDSKTGEAKFDITEGSDFFIERIVIEGNNQMKSEIILRDVVFKEGERINTKTISQTLQNMKATKYYSNVKIDYTVLGPEQVTIHIKIVEAHEVAIEFGAGISGNGLNGRFGFSSSNIFNTGKGFSLSITKGDEITKLGMVFYDPHLLGTDFELTAKTGLDQRDDEDYKQKRISNQIMVQKVIRENLKLGIGTRIDFVSIDEVSAEVLSEIPDAKRSERVVGLIGMFVYNQVEVDESGEAYKGYRVKMALYPSYADDQAYVRALATIVGHMTIGENANGQKHILTGRFSAGYASANTPFYERLYAGNNGTVRGFSTRIKPDGSVVGGGALLAGSGSYSFPLYKDSLRGVLFAEAATVGNSFDSLGKIRAIGGVGVRSNFFRTFLGTSIEGGFIFPLLRQPGDRIKPFYFTFGDYDSSYDL
jgi:outer membrane protein insertion porin family